MSLRKPEKIRTLQRKLYGKAKIVPKARASSTTPDFRFYQLVVAKHASGMTTKSGATIFWCMLMVLPARMRVGRVWTG